MEMEIAYNVHNKTKCADIKKVYERMLYLVLKGSEAATLVITRTSLLFDAS
jgi:hypothetical protein